MNTFTYGVVEEKYKLKNKIRIAYGIAIYADAENNGTATIVASMRDLTTNQSSAEGLVDYCNRLQLSPKHLDDVIEDFLAN